MSTGSLPAFDSRRKRSEAEIETMTSGGQTELQTTAIDLSQSGLDVSYIFSTYALLIVPTTLWLS